MASRNRQPPHGESLHALRTAIQVCVIAAGVLTWWLTRHVDHWALVPMGIVAAFTITSGLNFASTKTSMVIVNGAFLGIMLAAVVEGGGPAAAIGLVTMTLAWMRRRYSIHYLLANFVAYIWFPLVGGRFFHYAVAALGVSQHSIPYYLLVFVTFCVSLTVNFFLIVGYQCWLERTSLVAEARRVALPIMPAELFSAVLTVGAVFLVSHLGTLGMAVVALVLVIFQYLVGELLRSQSRGDELERLATTDTLTGLANRDSFLAEVGRLIEGAPSDFAVMLIDLDRFKEVNDTLGHHYGDELLRKLGPRLAASVPEDGLVARLGGDEFALLAPSLGEPGAAEQTASRLIACINEAVYVDELALEVGASIGIARYPDDGSDPNTLLRCADVAMYAAKESHVEHRFYASELDRHSVHKLSVLSDFRRALEHEELVVFYQPIVELGGSRVRSAEALVRWDHPEQGLLAPGAFMPIVEQTNLIGPMTLYVLDRAIAQCARWRADGHHLSVAVNLSVRNLLDRNLPWRIDTMLEEHGLPASALQLEITESMIMSDPDRVLATVTRLNSLGIRLSVDDYGTGFSSLANLRNLPIDELKIDRSFVSPMLRDESDLIIVRSTINLGHDLGLRVIAEGVEDAATLDRLGRLGCDMAQGYHMSRPLSAADCTRWLDGAQAVAA